MNTLDNLTADDLANLSAEELLASANVAESQPNSNATVVVRGETVRKVVSQPTKLDAKGVPTRPPKASRGRPRFTDPTDPQQIWAIANRKGMVTYIWAVALNAWIEVPKSKLKETLQNLTVETVNARIHSDNGQEMLLIG